MPQQPSADTLESQVVSLLPALRGFARRFERSAFDAEDLAQDVVVKALLRRHQFQPGTSPKAWLFTIMRNTYYSKHQRMKRSPCVSIDGSALEVSVQSQQEWVLYAAQVSEAVDRLPAFPRQALMMVASGETYDTVAKKCGCELGTVKSRVSRARMALLVSLGENNYSEAAVAL